MPDRHREKLTEAVQLERAGLLDRALDLLTAAARSHDPALAAEALRHRADVHRARCAWAAALGDARASAVRAAESGRPDLVAEAENAEAGVHMSRGSYEDAEPLLLGVLERAENPRIRGIALQNLGVIAAEKGDLEEARRQFEASRACFRTARYSRGVALALVNEGRMSLLAGDPRAAETLCGRADVIARREGDLEIAALAAFNRAESLVEAGRPGEAEEPASIALGYFTSVGNAWRRLACLRLFGDLHRRAGDLETARHCYERGLAVAREADTPLDISRLEALLVEVSLGTGDVPSESV